MLHVLKVNASRSDLQQNASAPFGQWYCREEDHDGNEDTDCRIDIIPTLSFSFPYNHSRDNHTYVVDRIANNVDEDAQHAKVSPGARGLGDVVFVLVMALPHHVRILAQPTITAELWLTVVACAADLKSFLCKTISSSSMSSSRECPCPSSRPCPCPWPWSCSLEVSIQFSLGAKAVYSP